MPCSDGGPSREEEYLDWKNRLDKLTRMLCALCKHHLQEGGTLPIEIHYWFDDHLKADAKREQREKEYKRDEVKRLEVERAKIEAKLAKAKSKL